MILSPSRSIKKQLESEGEEQSVPVSSGEHTESGSLDVEKPHDDGVVYHPHKKKSALPMIITVVVVILFGGGLFAYLFLNQSDTPAEDNLPAGGEDASILGKDELGEEEEVVDEAEDEETSGMVMLPYMSDSFGFAFEYPASLIEKKSSVSWAREFAQFMPSVDENAAITLGVRDFTQTYIALESGGVTIYDRQPIEVAGKKAFRFVPVDDIKPTVYIIEADDYVLHLEFAAGNLVTDEERRDVLNSITFASEADSETPIVEPGA